MNRTVGQENAEISNAESIELMGNKSLLSSFEHASGQQTLSRYSEEELCYVTHLFPVFIEKHLQHENCLNIDFFSDPFRSFFTL